MHELARAYPTCVWGSPSSHLPFPLSTSEARTHKSLLQPHLIAHAQTSMAGATVLKTALLEHAGLRVVHVEYQEWDKLMLLSAPTRVDWLRVRIGLVQE